MMTPRYAYSQKLKIFVSGASGFLGQQVLLQSDVEDWTSMEPELIPEYSTIIHLAADVSGSDESLVSNIILDTKIVDIACDTNSRLIYASGNHLYPFGLDFTNEDTLKPVGNYALSKFVGEKIATTKMSNNLFICRLADVFGPGQKHGNLFKAIENSLLNKVAITQIGSGSKRRTYMHVTDAALALLWLSKFNLELDNQCPIILNLGYPDSATVQEILRLVSENSNIQIQFQELSEDLSWSDIRTMKTAKFPDDVLNFKSFREALVSYIDEITNKKTTKDI